MTTDGKRRSPHKSFITACHRQMFNYFSPSFLLTLQRPDAVYLSIMSTCTLLLVSTTTVVWVEQSVRRAFVHVSVKQPLERSYL